MERLLQDGCLDPVLDEGSVQDTGDSQHSQSTQEDAQPVTRTPRYSYRDCSNIKLPGKTWWLSLGTSFTQEGSDVTVYVLSSTGLLGLQLLWLCFIRPLHKDYEL